MAIFSPNALKSPKIAQNQCEWYFQNPKILPFQKLADFLKNMHFFYKGPVHKGVERFCTQTKLSVLLREWKVYFAKRKNGLAAYGFLCTTVL